MIEQNHNKVVKFDDFNCVYDTLKAAVQQHQTYLLLIGESGCGKTTLLRYLLNDLDTHLFQHLYICGRQTTTSSMLGTLAKHFHLPSWCARSELMHLLTAAIRNMTSRFIIVIDETQELLDQTLIELRLLCEVQLQNEPLFTVIFSALPSLKERLLSAEHEPLLRRINTRLRLRGLRDEEVEQFLTACCSADEISRFTPQALSVLFEEARGLPAQILQYARYSLHTTAAGKPIDKQQMSDCIGSMESF